jgi:hypothetical protein
MIMDAWIGWRTRIFGSLIGLSLLLGLPMVAAANSVSLAWNPNPEPDLAGYKVYVGTSPGAYNQIIDVGHVTAYTVPNLVSGNTYYFAITAYDIFANESGLSRGVSTTISTPAVSGDEGENTTECAADDWVCLYWSSFLN